MQIVINISEDSYKSTCNGYMLPQDVENVVQGIKNGTPLPKGHGRLIDADKYRKDMQESREFNFFATLDFQQTIIEADKGESEE